MAAWPEDPFSATDRMERLTCLGDTGRQASTRRVSAIPVRVARVVFFFFAGLSLGFSVACSGDGSTADEAERSMREFQLAATFRDEGNIPDALIHLRRALELDPENARAHLLSGYIHDRRGDFPKAEEHLREGIRILAADPDQAGVLAEARNLLGVVLIHQERYPDAVRELDLSANDAFNAAPWYALGNLGWAYYEMGDHDRSLAVLQRAVTVQPRFCLGHYYLGQTLFALERFDDAEASLTSALEADERCGTVFQDAYKLRGETRARLGHTEEAVSDFERCVELNARSETGRACGRFLESVQ